MRIEQRYTRGRWTDVLVWDVIYGNRVETFSNYDDAYRRLVYLCDNAMLMKLH